MISQGEVERRHKKLMHEVATDDFYKIDLSNRINCYSCKCGHVTKTKDIDAGVTPMFLNCEKCNNSNAQSSFYKDIAPDQPHTIVWYRPKLEELFKLRKKPEMLEHILNGGLKYRTL